MQKLNDLKFVLVLLVLGPVAIAPSRATPYSHRPYLRSREREIMKRAPSLTGLLAALSLVATLSRRCSLSFCR